MKHAMDEDNVLNICKRLNQFAQDSLSIPTFVIFLLFSKVNELSKKTDDYLENIVDLGPVWLARNDAITTPILSPFPSYAVV